MVRINALGYKALVALKSLNAEQVSLIGDVVIGRDKHVLQDYAEEIKNWCTYNSVVFHERENAPSHSFGFEIAIGWRWIIQNHSPVIVFHDSLLPKLRGFNPLVTALINGHNETGVTCLLADVEYDRGDIVAFEKINLRYPKKIQEAIEEVSQLYGSLLGKVLYQIQHNSLVATPQNDQDASYSIWRDEEDYLIPWNWSADKIKRMIDAVGFPYLGARTRCEGIVYTIEDAEVVDDVTIENRCPGKVIFKKDNVLTVICGSGLLEIHSIRRTDGKPLDLLNKFRMRFY